MRAIPFIYCVVLTACLCMVYTVKNNTLISLRIRVVALEKKLHAQEAIVSRLDVEIAKFLDPKRLEAVARKAQYAHLQQPSKDDLLPL